jgi:hypothetical protein
MIPSYVYTGRLLSMAMTTLLFVACSSLRVGSDYEHSATFSGYRAFALMQREHHETRNPLVAQRAQDAIQAVLTAKGFTYVTNAAAADFVVDFSIGAQDRIDVDSYPAPYAGPWYGEYPRWWGYSYWGDVRQYREGTLAIDVFDARTFKPVWHGWAKKELTQSDIERSEAPIRAAVEAVLEGFPPR